MAEPYDSTRDKTRQQLQRIGAVALATKTVAEPVRRRVIAQRLPSHDWPDRVLRLTAIDAATGELVVFDNAVRCRARRRGGGQLRGARSVAAGDNRGPTVHGRWGWQLGQPRVARDCDEAWCWCPPAWTPRRRSARGRWPRSRPSPAARSPCSPTATRWRLSGPMRWIHAAASPRRRPDASKDGARLRAVAKFLGA